MSKPTKAHDDNYAKVRELANEIEARLEGVGDLLLELESAAGQIHAVAKDTLEIAADYASRCDTTDTQLIDSAMVLAGLRGVHWLVLMHEHWDKDLRTVLLRIHKVITSIEEENHQRTDPHGARQG